MALLVLLPWNLPGRRIGSLPQFAIGSGYRKSRCWQLWVDFLKSKLSIVSPAGNMRGHLIALQLDNGQPPTPTDVTLGIATAATALIVALQTITSLGL